MTQEAHNEIQIKHVLNDATENRCVACYLSSSFFEVDTRYNANAWTAKLSPVNCDAARNCRLQMQNLSAVHAEVNAKEQRMSISWSEIAHFQQATCFIWFPEAAEDKYFSAVKQPVAYTTVYSPRAEKCI